MNTLINIFGEVEIINGKNRVRARNHFVDAGLKGLISQILYSHIFTAADIRYYNLWASAFHCYIGEDTTTVTIPGHNALIDPIGASPGTPPNAMAIPSVHDGTADGDWYMLITATWNPGTVAGTLGEAALYMKAPDKTQFRWNAEGGYNPAEVMISRLSSALDFSSFIIDNTKPLVVNWTIHFKFA